MAEQLDPNDLVTVDELALSTMWENAALVELLERKGVLTRQEMLAMIQELHQREPTAMPPRLLPHFSHKRRGSFSPSGRVALLTQSSASWSYGEPDTFLIHTRAPLEPERRANGGV